MHKDEIFNLKVKTPYTNNLVYADCLNANIFRAVQIILLDVEMQASHRQICTTCLFTCQPGKSPLLLLPEVTKQLCVFSVEIIKKY